MVHTRLTLVVVLLAWAALCLPAHAYCFEEAGARYQIDPQLLRAIAIGESSLNPKAIGFNRDKKGHLRSQDYGLMQINSTHIPRLRELGLIRNEKDLLNNACLNVQIGAWILAQSLQHCWVSWECFGSYNAGFSEGNVDRRMKYARYVYKIYTNLRTRG